MLTVFLRTACASPSLTIHLGCKCIPLNVPETVQGACLLVLERWAHLRRNHCISNGIGISETWPCAGSCSLSLCTMTLWTCSEWCVWLLQTQKLSVVWVINYAFAYIKKKKGRGKKKRKGREKEIVCFSSVPVVVTWIWTLLCCTSLLLCRLVSLEVFLNWVPDEYLQGGV